MHRSLSVFSGREILIRLFFLNHSPPLPSIHPVSLPPPPPATPHPLTPKSPSLSPCDPLCLCRGSAPCVQAYRRRRGPAWSQQAYLQSQMRPVASIQESVSHHGRSQSSLHSKTTKEHPRGDQDTRMHIRHTDTATDHTATCADINMDHVQSDTVQ